MKNLKGFMVAALVVCVSANTATSQESKPKPKKHKQKTEQKGKQGIVVPPWAEAHHYDATSHVYFPDYYTYYDPARGGYVYWKNNKYVFTPSLPAHLQNVDLAKSRIQILKGLSLDLHPEQDYPYYMKLYPPDPNNNANVPVPIPGNPAMR